MRGSDSGCRCLGYVESISASGALIKTENGIRPSNAVAIETLTTGPGHKSHDLVASIVRESPGEIAIEWREFASAQVFEVLAEVALGSGAGERSAPVLGRVRFCELSRVMAG